MDCSPTCKICCCGTDRQDPGDSEAAHLHRALLPHLPEALRGPVKAPELGKPIDHGVPHDDVPLGQFDQQAVRVFGEAEPQAQAEHGAGAEEVVREAAADREGVEREQVRRGRGRCEERREGEGVGGVGEVVGQGQRGVEAGQRGGGRQEERDGRVQRRRGPRVEGDEGGERGAAGGGARREDSCGRGARGERSAAPPSLRWNTGRCGASPRPPPPASDEKGWGWRRRCHQIAPRCGLRRRQSLPPAIARMDWG
jgi:hypothetical protein